MQLQESDAVLSAVCRSVERLTSGIEDLMEIVLRVRLFANFDDMPEAQHSMAIRKTPAAYRRSEKEIVVVVPT